MDTSPKAQYDKEFVIVLGVGIVRYAESVLLGLIKRAWLCANSAELVKIALRQTFKRPACAVFTAQPLKSSRNTAPLWLSLRAV